jgi:GntR family transcriptional regulator
MPANPAAPVQAPLEDFESRLRDRVSHSSTVPLHHQVRLALASMIESGELPPGSPLPSERELADLLDVSLAPVRQSMRDLARDGHIERVRGRGTCVRTPKVEFRGTLFTGGFTEGLREQGFEPIVRVLHAAVEAAPANAAAALEENALFRLTRLITVFRSPVALLETWLSPTRFPILLDADFTTTGLYSMLQRHYGLFPLHQTSFMEVVRCNQSLSEDLRLPLGSPVLLIEGTVFDREGRPFESVRTLAPADQIRYYIDAYYEKEDARAPNRQ